VMDEMLKSGVITDYEEKDGRYVFTKSSDIDSENFDSTLNDMNTLINSSNRPDMIALREDNQGDALFIGGNNESLGRVIGMMNDSEKVTDKVNETAGYVETDGGVQLINNDVTRKIIDEAGITDIDEESDHIDIIGEDADKVKRIINDVRPDYRKTVE